MLQRGLLSTSHLTTNERGFIGHFNSVYKSTKPIGVYPTLITSNDDGYERNHICFYSATALFDQSVIDIAPFIGMLIFDAQESRWKMYNGEEFVLTPQAGGTDKFFVPEFNKVIGWNPNPGLPSNCEPFAVFLSMGQANGWIGSHLYMYLPQTQGFQDITPSVGMVVTEPTLGWTLICRAAGGESGTHAWEILNVKSVLDHLDTPPTLTSPDDDGKSYLIKAGATGAWSGQDNNIAVWQNSGWAIIHRSIIGIGNAIYVRGGDLSFVWDGTVWKNQLPGHEHSAEDIQPRAGASITRDGNGLVSQVAVTGGPTYTVTRNGSDQITQIATSANVWTFTRDGEGRISGWSVA
jgi:hypothetical protein